MMITWLHIALISLFSAVLIVLVLILLVIRKKCSKPTTPLDVDITDAERCRIQDGEEIRHRNPQRNASNYKSSYNHVFRPRRFFSWTDHPSLVTHAVENGWPRFAFVPSPSNSNETYVEMSWEVFEESADHMQKIRLNHGLRKSITARDPSSGAFSVIRTALPLPGPQFANASFPHEAYFEIKILLPNHDQVEMSKIIRDDSIYSKRNIYEEVNVGRKQECENETVVAIGLIGEGHLPVKLPGSFQGSVGFNSSGSVYLDGMKLVEESKKEGWGRAGNVIGCGYNPAQKKVFFTVNSKLVNEIRCKSEEFEHPLYPTLAANTDISVAVNLGQSPFKFEAANSRRTPNPCFINTHLASSNTAPAYYELDSRELFSMGRIDGKWNHRTAPRTSHESIVASEPDLFEIVVK